LQFRKKLVQIENDLSQELEEITHLIMYSWSWKSKIIQVKKKLFQIAQIESYMN